MFTFLEVKKIDPDYRWLELMGGDDRHQEPVLVRITIDDYHAMMVNFSERYMARREHPFRIPGAQAALIDDFFQEAAMARVLHQKKHDVSDLARMLPTTVLHFLYPERTSFRKSIDQRIEMFLVEARASMERHAFQKALDRLDWVLLLDPDHQFAFALKVVCYRSWHKHPECVPVFETWISRHPRQPEPRLGLGELWLFLGQNQRAKETLEALIEICPRDCSAQLALAQARIKLDLDPLPQLRKAWLINAILAKGVIEGGFDFRSSKTGDLEPMTLTRVAEAYRLPLARVITRASKGALPMHAPDPETGLMRFSWAELDRHYEILKKLGLEIGGPLPSRDQRPETGDQEAEAGDPAEAMVAGEEDSED